VSKQYISSALIAGSIVALLSAIPFVNSCCCLWLLAGGFFAAHLVRNDIGLITSGNGFLSGLFAGIWSSILYTILNTLMMIIRPEAALDAIYKSFETGPFNLPPETLELIYEFASSPLFNLGIQLGISMITFPVIMGLGGLIYALIFRKKKSETDIKMTQQFPQQQNQSKPDIDSEQPPTLPTSNDSKT